MLPECPDDFKHLLPYLQRASELKGREPVIAYYTGFYAANLGLSKGYTKTSQNEEFLMSLLDELELEKRELHENRLMHDQEAAKTAVLQFAMRIFLAADNEDRSGQATKKTARLFLVSSQFLEVTKVFGALGEELEDRIKYAKWKATDIVKAVNEGRQPVPGPPGHVESTVESHSNVSPPPPTYQSSVSPPPTNLPSMAGQYQSPPPINNPMTQQGPPIVLPSITIPSPVTIASPPPPAHTHVHAQPVSYSSVDPKVLTSAEKYSRFAVSALQFEDVATAIQNLELALNILRSSQK